MDVDQTLIPVIMDLDKRKIGAATDFRNSTDVEQVCRTIVYF